MKVPVKKICKACIFIIFIAIGGALFSLTSLGAYLEEEYGLAWLFDLRGSVSAPKEVVIVSVDKNSAEILHLPDDPEKWPRTYYAQLIKKLNQQNPATIAINITFNESRDPLIDQGFADEIAKGRNIVLSNYLKRSAINTVSSLSLFNYEHFINPIPVLNLAAISTAPFPLPKTAATIKQFWTYTQSGGGIQTFPVAVFQLYLFKQTYAEIISLLDQLSVPNLISFERPLQEIEFLVTIQKLQTEIGSDPGLLKRLDQLLSDAQFSVQKKRLLASWLALLKRPGSLYFNHYGTARTITTIPFYQALVSDVLNPSLFHNKVVLIGYSEDIEPEKNQGIYTVFSNSYGETTSPIEIAATAIANLIDNNWLRPVSFKDQFFLILVWGAILLLIFCLFSYSLGTILIISLSVAYLAIAYYSFSHLYFWFPIFIPLLLQVPLVLLISSTLHFLKTKKEHQNVHKAFSHYLPNDVVNKISYQNDDNALGNYGEVMQGLCMATDAEQYTTLSETMRPQALNDLMNSYYGVMFPLVKKFNGIISDVIGDAMLAIWTNPDEEIQIRSNACHAALEIKAAIDQFNSSQPYQLPTRIGLHFGEMRLGNVGAFDHYEYRAVGDTVNTATRVEGLNKLLGTHLLVSEKVIKGLTGFVTREIGFFILKGKKKPVHIYELVGHVNQECSLATEFASEFAKALKCFQDYQWDEALKQWTSIRHQYPNDGATLFYINYLTRNKPPLSVQNKSNQPAIVNIGNITIPLEI